MEKVDIVTRLPFYDKLTDVEKEKLLRYSQITSVKSGQMLYSKDRECMGLIYVISGEVRTYILSEEGREVTLFRLTDGDTCVLSASCIISEITFDTEMSVEKDTKLLIISTDIFKNLVENNIYVRCFMYELLTTKFSTVMFTFQQILFKGFDKRLAGFLIEEYVKNGDEINLTHFEIAKLTNSAREVVARMLKRFAEDGILEYERGKIKIIDIEKLKNI